MGRSALVRDTPVFQVLEATDHGSKVRDAESIEQGALWYSQLMVGYAKRALRSS